MIKGLCDHLLVPVLEIACQSVLCVRIYVMLSFPYSLISLPVTPSCQCWCTWTACTRSLSWRSRTSSRPYPKSLPTIPRYLHVYTIAPACVACTSAITYVCTYVHGSYCACGTGVVGCACSHAFTVRVYACVSVCVCMYVSVYECASVVNMPVKSTYVIVHCQQHLLPRF